MKFRNYSLGLLASALIFAASCNAQPQQPDDQISPRPNLYQCEGCEGIYERDAATLSNFAIMADANEPGERMILRGTVYSADRTTPAAGIILYAYQTNADGLYANGSPQTQWSRRHGRLRGWAKTDADGNYLFETIKPAPYPNDVYPAHIHLTVLEPEKPPYWIDDVVFAGEFGVTDQYRTQMVLQGGDGIVSLDRDNQGSWVAIRDIFLEKHP